MWARLIKRSKRAINVQQFVSLQLLEITAPLAVLDESSLGVNGSSSSSSTCDSSCEGDYSGIKLCLLDTPGPNEAGEEGLKYQVSWEVTIYMLVLQHCGLESA